MNRFNIALNKPVFRWGSALRRALREWRAQAHEKWVKEWFKKDPWTEENSSEPSIMKKGDFKMWFPLSFEIEVTTEDGKDLVISAIKD